MATEKKYYQWVKGENSPNIETFEKNIKLGEEEYLLFESGTQVNTKLIGDYVMSIPNPEEPFISTAQTTSKTEMNPPVAYEQYTNDTDLNHEKNLGKAEIIPHPDDIPAVREFNRKHQKTAPVQKQVVNNHNTLQGLEAAKPVNPIHQLIDKSKKEKTEVNIKLFIDLPSKAFLNVLLESFEGDEQDVINHMLKTFKTPEFDKELEKFIRNHLGIAKKPIEIPVDIVEGNVSTPTLDKKVGV